MCYRCSCISVSLWSRPQRSLSVDVDYSYRYFFHEWRGNFFHEGRRILVRIAVSSLRPLLLWNWNLTENKFSSNFRALLEIWHENGFTEASLRASALSRCFDWLPRKTNISFQSLGKHLSNKYKQTFNPWISRWMQNHGDQIYQNVYLYNFIFFTYWICRFVTCRYSFIMIKLSLHIFLYAKEAVKESTMEAAPEEPFCRSPFIKLVSSFTTLPVPYSHILCLYICNWFFHFFFFLVIMSSVVIVVWKNDSLENLGILMYGDNEGSRMARTRLDVWKCVTNIWKQICKKKMGKSLCII